MAFVPEAMGVEQVEPQLMVPPLDVTVPEPVRVTVSVWVRGGGVVAVNTAFVVTAADVVVVQVVLCARCSFLD